MMFGGGTQPSAYCKLSTYVQHNAPLLYENIQDLCMFGALNPRGKIGVTLLLPEKKVQEQIDATVGKDAAAAVELIQSLILTEYIPSISGFKGDISNRAGKKLPIKKGGNPGELENGAIISVDSAFQRLHTDSNIACYKLTGNVPVSTSESTRKKKGGFYSGGADADFGRYGGLKMADDWRAHVETIKSQLLIYVKNQYTDIDPLTLTLLSLSEASGRQYDSKLPGGPLAALFLGEKITNDGIKWGNTNKSYDNKQVLTAINSVYKASTLDINMNTMGINTIVDNMRNGLDDFWLSAKEFCYYFTIPFIMAIKTKDTGKITMIIDHYLNNVYGKQGDDRYFFLKTSNNTFNELQKERYCTLLSFRVNDAYSTSGINMNTADIADGTTFEGRLYGWEKVRPDNTKTATSYHNIVANFWKQTVMDQ